MALNLRRLLTGLWVLGLLGGCASSPSVTAPIEDRTSKTTQVTIASPAPKRSVAPQKPTDGPIVKPLPDVEAPAQRAIALPSPDRGTEIPSTGDADKSAFAQPLEAEETQPPAIAQLLAKADVASGRGEQDAARANVERALKIAPRDPALWNRLASISYAQADWAQTKALAERSNSLAQRDSALAKRNWTLIGNAELKLGNEAAAAQAFERAGQR